MYTRARNQAFTLLELLVVVTIIVVLLALLVPALDQAIFQAQHVKCLTNLRTIGQGQSMYLQDNRQRYPEMTTWSTLVSKNGSINRPNGYYGEGQPYNGVYGSYESGHPRLLNIYMGYTDPRGEVPIAECPLDLGDSEPNHAAKENCYQQYGTSYLAAFVGGRGLLGEDPPPAWFRVKSVYGFTEDPSVNSLRHNQISGRTQTKILLGDWPWHANRLWRFENTRWHGYEGTDPGTEDPDAYRQLNFLFADGHVELFDQMQVRETEQEYQGANIHQYDRNWLWW